ncbi:MAG TPA: hypothetical protein VHB02_05185 [Acidimicrobiales bacterium]|nr:hypothetical protein [Acidimicrobiales bacterium]
MVEPPTTRPLTLEQSAALAGAYRWAEERLFRLAGAWAADPAPAAVQVHLDEVSGQHAWHAQLWADRLPVLDWFDQDAATAPLGPVAGPLLAALAALPADPAARMAGLYRVVVPRLVVGYDRHLARTAAATDGPVVRALRLVRRDQVDAWRAGEALLQDLLAGAGDGAAAVAVASAAARDLETVVADHGGSAGLFPWPGSVATPPTGPKEPQVRP